MGNGTGSPGEGEAARRQGWRAYRAANQERINRLDRAARAGRRPVINARKRRAYVARPEVGPVRTQRWRTGASPEQWAAMFAGQGGRCYLCGDELPDLPPGLRGGRAKRPGGVIVVLDHDHRHCPKGWSCPVCWRGIAHGNCNTAIGLLGDDPERIIGVGRALAAAQAAVARRAAAAPVQLALFEPGEVPEV
jgi:hypothetical protein